MTPTLDELRDWFAARDGWKLVFPKGGHYPFHWENVDGRIRKTHPHPPNLTGAASAMPERWSLEITIDSKLNVVRGAVYPPGMYYRGPHVEIATCEDEIKTRYLLAKLACEAMDTTKEKAQ